MKKLLLSMLIATALFSFAACKSPSAPEAPTAQPAAQAATEAAEAPTSAPELKWKDRMGSIEKVVGPRVVIFHNMVRFDPTVNEFAEFGEPPAANDGSYPAAFVERIWTKPVGGTLRVLDAKANESEISYEDFSTARIREEENGTATFIFGDQEIADFKYLITVEHETLLYVSAEETITMPDLFTTIGYIDIPNVFATASDGFWCCTDTPDETAGSEIRGLLSGAVNCNLTVEGKGGAGKINDIFYIDVVE